MRSKIIKYEIQNKGNKYRVQFTNKWFIFKYKSIMQILPHLEWRSIDAIYDNIEAADKATQELLAEKKIDEIGWVCVKSRMVNQ